MWMIFGQSGTKNESKVMDAVEPNYAKAFIYIQRFSIYLSNC